MNSTPVALVVSTGGLYDNKVAVTGPGSRGPHHRRSLGRHRNRHRHLHSHRMRELLRRRRLRPRMIGKRSSFEDKPHPDVGSNDLSRLG